MKTAECFYSFAFILLPMGSQLSVIHLPVRSPQKKGAGTAARTCVMVESMLRSRGLSRLLSPAAQGNGTEACQRQQRPAWLRHGSDVAHGDGIACHRLDVSGVDGEGFR